ncbi:MAG TPA: hypothetical protein DIW17_03835 [Clostridiales bacterium]|jgi:DNA-binding transcriptional LysR family regulator|nr:hypothetical protein [Clostridiales bacterium]
MIELKYAKYIMKIAETKNISLAAKELFTSQPTLSRVLKNVEEEIGFPIFNRKVQPLKPTIRGLLYLNYLEEIAGLEKKMQNNAKKLSEQPKKIINVGLVPERGLIIYSQILPKLMQEQKNINIMVQNGFSKNLEAFFWEGKLDICILNSPLQRYTDRKIILSRENILLLVQKNNPIVSDFLIENGSVVKFLDCEIQGVVVLDKQSRMRAISDEIIQYHRIKTKNMIEVFNQTTAAQLVASSNFITFVAESFFNTISKKIKDNVVSYKVGTTPYTWDLLLLYATASERPLSRKIASQYHALCRSDEQNQLLDDL